MYKNRKKEEESTEKLPTYRNKLKHSISISVSLDASIETIILHEIAIAERINGCIYVKVKAAAFSQSEV